jgi:A/G-specific adenine glycosylase
VLRRWAGLGYNLRALRLHQAARQIVRQGSFPTRAANLEHIDGIGPFTAAVVASFAFGEPVAAVDTNVERVVARLAGAVDGGLTKTAVRESAGALVSWRAAGRWNQAMMDLGALVCTARSPKCDACPLARWCRGRSMLASPELKVAEARASYRPAAPYRRSRRYYRGRIVDALRRLPPGRSLAAAQILERLPDRDGLDDRGLAGLVESLRRDGLVRVTPGGRVRLP